MLVYGIPSFKLEKDVVEAEIDVMRQMGVDIKTGVEVGKDITIDELKKQGYKAFYIAIGCQGSRKAGVAGEDAKGVMSAVDFLKAISSTVCWLMTRPHTGQCGTPMRAYSRRR